MSSHALQLNFPSIPLLSPSCAPYTPIVYCRYKEIVKKDHCSKRRITLLILLPHTLLALALLVPLSAQKVVKSCCCAILTIPELKLPMSLFLVVPFTFVAQIYYSFRLYYHLKKHFATVAHKSGRVVNQRRNEQKLTDEKSILRAVALQALSPLILSSPIIILLVFGRFMPRNSLFVWMFSRISAYFSNLNPSFDAFTTLFIIKVYKRALRRFLANRFCRTDAVEQQKEDSHTHG